MMDALPEGFSAARLQTGEALALLRRVWPAEYGETGCPDFTPALLNWLYDGPQADRHRLLAVHDAAGRLVGASALLFRALRLGGPAAPEVVGYISTHLTVDPTLEAAPRRQVARYLTAPRSLRDDPDSLILAFHEAGKAVIDAARRGAAKHDVTLSERSLTQAVVNRRRLLAGPESQAALRAAVPADAPELSARLARLRGDLVWTPDAESLWHHLSAAPGALALVAEEEGRITGAMGCYRLGWLRDGAVKTMLICEILDADRPEVANSLLRAALRHAESEGLRGVVLENATHLPPALTEACGILPTPRAMHVMIRATRSIALSDQGFFCDIK